MNLNRLLSQRKTIFSGVFLLSVLSIFAGVAKGQDSLLPDVPVKKQISANQTHTYKISASANQFFFITAEQKGVDISLKLESENEKIVERNGQRGSSHLEILSFISEKDKTYLLEIKSANQGFYELEMRELRPAIPTDRFRVSIEKNIYEILKLQNQQNPNDLQGITESYREILKNLKINSDQIGKAIALQQMGQSLIGSGDLKDSVNYFTDALLIWEKLGIQSEIANSLNLRCLANFRLNNYQSALEDSALALKKYQELGDKTGESELLMLTGNLYATLGETSLAIDYYHQASNNWLKLKNFHRFAATLNNIGLAYRDLGNSEQAFDYYTRALKTFREDRPNTRGEANVLNQIGFYYLSKNELEKSLEYFQQSVPIWKRITDAFGEPVSLLGIGEIYEKQGEFDKAVWTLNQSLILARLRGAKSVEALILLALARIEQKQENLESAREKIEFAINIIESTRAPILNQQLRTLYFARTKNFYDFYIQLLMQMHEKSPEKGFNELAFQANEQARARSLVELLSLGSSEIHQGIDPLLLEKEQNLQLKLNAAEQNRFQMVLRNLPSEQIKIAELTLQKLSDQYENLQSEIRRRSPRYSVLRNRETLKLDEIQSLLDEKTVFLEYSLGQKNCFLWLISSKSFKSFVLPECNNIEAAAKDFYEKIKNEKTALEADASAKKLSRMILEPIWNDLGEKRLLIASDGILQFIPFAALSEKDGIPLIQKHEIINIPSANVLSVIRRENEKQKRAKKSLAVFADPVFSKNDLRVKPSEIKKEPGLPKKINYNYPRNLLDDEAKLPRLPGSRKEALAIRNLVSQENAKISLDFAANRKNVFQKDLENYNIIHFATHSLIDSQQPEFSGIALSMVDEKGNYQDGFLRLYEIFNLNLRSDLVVLSACETGLGKDIRGEGLIGLTRGFMYAGAKRIVVSLWKVDDRGTSELMKRFYQGMLGKEQLLPSDALRKAQISMSKEKQWQSPFYWSSFTIQGDWK